MTKNTDDVNTKSTEKTELLDLFIDILSVRIISIALGLIMIIWYDLTGDWGIFRVSLMSWIFWSRPVGVFLLVFGLYSMWKNKSS